MEQFAARLWQEEEGQALTEYALLLLLVSLVAVSAMKGLASSLTNVCSQARYDLALSHNHASTHNNQQFDLRLKGPSSRGYHERNFKSRYGLKRDHRSPRVPF